MTKVIVLDDARVMNLPGRRAREIVGAKVGATNSTIRVVEIEPDRPGAVRRGPHVHHGFEECIHVIAGEGVTRTDLGDYAVKAGDTILIPADERHATYNTGPAILRLICFFPVNDIAPGTVEFVDWDSS
ncbi:MAG: cupin domain-containing protein [Rhodomicrobiaceae bacterium]